MQNNNVDAKTVAFAIATAHTLRGWTLDNAPDGYAGVACALIAFCDKRDLTLYAVYVGNAGSGFIRAIVIRSDGMARRVYWYCGAWNYANTRVVPIARMRINRYHVAVDNG